jgi:hypothetical protein
MARPKQTIRTVYFHIGLPEDLAAKIQLHVFSELEGKIPMGAYQKFFTEVVRAKFDADEAFRLGAD